MISFSLPYSIHKNIRSYFNMRKTKEHKANQQWTEKMLMLLLADSLIILISYFTALLLRFDFVFSSIPKEYLIG